jgi:hypothetical protein
MTKRKKCKKCNKNKCLSSYYVHPQMGDGHLNICKECIKAAENKRYHQNKKNIVWLDNERRRTRERNIRLGYNEKYKKLRTKEQEEKSNQAREEWIKRNPAAHKAHIKANNALRNGKLKKKACEICGNKHVEMHHQDYSKPLEVMWLCRKHHAEIHHK